MKQAFKVHGLKELEAALLDLKTATAKSVVRRNLMKAAQPIADAATALAPDDPSTTSHDLHRSIGVGTKLSKRQRRLARRVVKSGVEVYVGPGPMPHAHLQEFGNSRHSARPFMRPAWDENKDGVVEEMRDLTWQDLERIAARNAKKQAKLLRGK